MSTHPSPVFQGERWPSWLRALLGEDEVLQAQVAGVLFSTLTYLVYGGIAAAQHAMGLLSRDAAVGLAGFGITVNLVFYALVRSGRVLTGLDPGLSRTQLIVGILLMYAAYAAIGPAASGLLVVMASHVVYSMFMMTPRQVWYLVGLTLGGLVAMMTACASLWPERYLWPVQISSLLYALLVMPLIALLAHRVTGMTQRLKAQHAELHVALAKLHELATCDELTHTHNRRHMSALLRTQQAHHRRLGAPLGLALIDIDLFKSVNDTHGHAVGDDVLRGFANLAKQQLRAADLLGRWGGEEFLVLMPQTTRVDAKVALERLQNRLRDSAAEAMPLGLVITFSSGVTELAADEDPEVAIERADQAMYRAKATGRARCVET